MSITSAEVSTGANATTGTATNNSGTSGAETFSTVKASNAGAPHSVRVFCAGTGHFP